MKSMNPQKLKGRRFSKEQKKEIISLYKKGEKIKNICDKFGFKNSNSVYRLLHSAHVETNRNDKSLKD